MTPPVSRRCSVPPKGWTCSRPFGHDGPCAATSVTELHGEAAKRAEAILARRGAIQCAFCPGDGEVCNPGNGDPAVKVTDWLPPVICPRCGGTGKEPNP